MTPQRRGGWPGPRKPSLDVRFDPDLLARITAYAERHKIKRGEAVRRATAVGMDALDPAPTPEDSTRGPQ